MCISNLWATCFPFQTCVLDSRFQPGVRTCTVLAWLSQSTVLVCGTAGRKPGSLSRILIYFYILLLRLSALFPGATVHHELLYPKDTFQVTQLALTNEEVVNWSKECRKAVCSLTYKALRSQQERLSIGLNRICSSWSGLLETSLYLKVFQKATARNKILVVERKIFPLRGIEELIYVLLVVYKLLQKGTQSSTESGAAHSSAVPGGHYCWFWYPKE